MKENPHLRCSLAKLDVAQLQETTLGAIDNNDQTTAYHCGIHHMMLKHAGLGLVNVPFFQEKAPQLFIPVADMSRLIGRQTEDQLQEMLERFNNPSVPPEVRLNLMDLRKFVVMNTVAQSAVSYLTAISLKTWVETRGTGCVFSVVDPELCKGEA